MALETKYSLNDGKSLWTVRVNGEVDVANAQQLRKVLTEIYEETPADIFVDSADLCYIDSTGLGVLIGAHGRMQEKGHKLFIGNPRENIAKLLRITSLDSIFCQAQ